RTEEGPRPLRVRQAAQLAVVRSGGGILIAVELDIAAERDGAELPPGAVAVVEAGDLGTEADGEGGDADAAPAPGEIMPHLVDEDDQGQDDQERNDGAGDEAERLLQQFHICDGLPGKLASKAKK